MVADYSKKNKLLEDEIYTLKKEYDDCMLLIKEKEKTISQLKYIYIYNNIYIL